MVILLIAAFVTGCGASYMFGRSGHAHAYAKGWNDAWKARSTCDLWITKYDREPLNVSNIETQGPS